ncbi:hypothetical protein MTO96_032192 [Rhipicephalus appendiculatus]
MPQGVSASWCSSMRRNYLRLGFYAAHSKVPQEILSDSDPLENDNILRTDSSLVRVDARAVTSSDVAQVSAREQVMLDRHRQQRKRLRFSPMQATRHRPQPRTVQLCMMVDVDILNGLLAASLRCRVCGGCAKLVTGDRDYSLDKKLIVK